MRRPFWLASAGLSALVAAAALVYTTVYYIRDAQLTQGWTLVRQNLETLRGKATCGIADDLVLPRPGSIVALARVPVSNRTPTSPFALDGVWPRGSRPPYGGANVWGTWTSNHADVTGSWASPWYELPKPRAGGRVGLYVAGSNDHGEVGVEWGRRERRRIVRLGDGQADIHITPGQVWTLLTERDLPPRPAAADVLRVTADKRVVEPGDWLGVSGPVRYVRETLAAAIRRDPRRVLISPDFGLYFPCAMRPPQLAHGRAQVPQLSVLPLGGFPLTDSSSPFNGITDLYGVFQLPLDDSPLRQTELTVYATKPLPRGARPGR